MAALASISFINPWLLLGLFGAALPVIAHLLTRRARRRIVFPTIRLLRESRASQSKLYRLRRWMLLALRALAAALVALAFARPVWLERGARPLPAGKGCAVVLLLDNSASSAQTAGGVRLIDSTRALAGRLLGSLHEGSDLVNIVYASAQPRLALPQLTANLPALRAELAGLGPTQERADIPAAIAAAGRLLAEHPGQRRLVILSDMQRTNWADVSLKGPQGELLPEGTVVTVVPVGAVEAFSGENVCLTAGRCHPVQPIAGRAAQLTVRVCNYSSQERTVRVEAAVDGRPLEARQVQIKPDDAAEASFQVVLESPGEHLVVFSIGPDGLEADNAFYLVATAVRRVPAVVVGDENPDQNDTGTYFAVRALSPAGDVGDPVEARHLTSADLSYARIADAEAVFVGCVGRLSEEALAALHMYANQGGGVVFFCGEGPVAENLLGLNSLARHGELLPWIPGPPRDLAKDGSFLTIGSGAWDSPALAPFDQAGQLALKQIQFARLWSTGPLRQGATALLTYADGTPALAWQNVGAGKVVLANFSPSMACSNLGKYGSFVTLMHSLVESLRPGQDWRGGATAGRSFSHLVSSPSAVSAGEVRIVCPDGLELPARVSGDASRFLVHFGPPALPGFYRVAHGRGVLSTAAVNVDGREGDLRRMDEQTLREHMASPRCTLALKSAQTHGPIINVRGRALWPWCVLAAMAMIAAELVLLTVWKR